MASVDIDLKNFELQWGEDDGGERREMLFDVMVENLGTTDVVNVNRMIETLEQFSVEAMKGVPWPRNGSRLKPGETMTLGRCVIPIEASPSATPGEAADFDGVVEFWVVAAYQDDEHAKGFAVLAGKATVKLTAGAEPVVEFHEELIEG